MEPLVQSKSSVGRSSEHNTLKLLLDKELECDEKLTEIVTYIQRIGIEGLNLIELDNISSNALLEV